MMIPLIELISKVCIRKSGKLKDGSKVTIKIPINSITKFRE